MKKKMLSLLLSISITLSTGAAFAESQVDTEYVEAMAQFINDNYLYDVERKQLTEGALKGLFYHLDPYSNYYTEEEYKTLTEELTKETNTAGIGIRIIESENTIKIIELIKDHAAEKSGLKVGDVLVSVGEADVTGMAVENVSNLVRGEVGSTVKIGVKREEIEDTLYFDVVRTAIVFQSVESKTLNAEVGYIKINEFNKGSFMKIEKILKEFQKQNIKKIVFDVRNNPGGFLTDVINTLGLVVPEGPVMHVSDKHGNKDTFYSFNKSPGYKLAVLTNKNSASAAEIFAGAVKDRKVGTIIGTKTFGKGTVQDIIPLERGGAVKITVAEYFTPNMHKVNKIGIMPDILVEDTLDTEGKDIVLERALKELKK